MLISPYPPAAVVCWSIILLSLTTFVQLSFAATAEEWRSRSIYQLITDRFAREDGSTDAECDINARQYCGGSFQGIINHLDYIQGMGFTAIWISPVITNIEGSYNGSGEAYHGFWGQDISTINSHFGTADDLIALSQAVHDRDMYIMIDVVVNDLASFGDPAMVNYSSFAPFDKEDFHPYCEITDWLNLTDIEHCWLADSIVSLPDLDTDSTQVQDIWQTWISEMVANYSLDGLRIDAAKHVDHPFWAPFQAAASVFTLGEVYDSDPLLTCYWMDDALASLLNYPTWFQLATIMPNSSQDMSGLGWGFSRTASECRDVTVMGTFSENHDVSRFANFTSDMSQLKNVLAWNVWSDGIPIVYYGAEQAMSGGNDPDNRGALWLNGEGYNTSAPLYTHVKTLNAGRNAVNAAMAANNEGGWGGYWAYKANVLYETSDILVLRKGYDVPVVSAFTNVGADGADAGPYLVGETNWLEGESLVEILACETLIAGPSGQFNITLVGGLPQVWIPATALVNTTLCANTSAMKTAHKASSKASPALASSLTTVSLCFFIAGLLFLC